MSAVRPILLLTGLLLPWGILQADDRPVSVRVAEEVEFLDVDSPGVRGRAAYELEKIGPEAKPAVKSLIRLLADHRASNSGAFPVPVSHCAQQALLAIGSEGVESLIAALSVQSADIRARSAGVLGGIGPKAAHALPTLTITARDLDENVRFASVVAIGRIASTAESVEAVLCEALRDHSRHVRAAAADALSAVTNTSESSSCSYDARLPEEEGAGTLISGSVGSESTTGAIAEKAEAGDGRRLTGSSFTATETASRRITDVFVSRARRNRRILFLLSPAFRSRARAKVMEIVRRAASNDSISWPDRLL